MARYRLGSICQIISGSTPKTGVQEYWNGDKKWITPAELSESDYIIYDTERKLTEAGVRSAGLTPLPKGTVILSSRAPIGKVAIAGCEMYCNQGFKNFVCSDIINNKYLYWYLRSKTDFLNSLGRGATFKEISKSTVADIELDIPELSEQSKRVAHFEKLQSIITSRRIQLAKLDELVKCRFVELFGDPGSNPRKWPIVTVQDIVTEVKYGTSRPAVAGGKYPYLRMNNITYDGKLDLSDVKRIDVPDDELPKCTVKRGDILFNRTNSKELVGKTCLYDKDELMVLAGFIIRVRVNELVIPEFVVQFMNMPTTKALLFAMCRNAVSQANINAKELQSISIYLPSLDIQKQFSAFTHRIDKLRFVIQQSLDETQKLFDSLMQEYFD